MATNFDDLTQEQQAQVRVRFTLGDPRAYVYGLGLGGDVLTRTPAPSEQTDRVAELETILRDIWDRRASVSERGAGYEVALDGDLCERIRRSLHETR